MNDCVIGSKLSEKQLAVLQAVAYGCEGSVVCSLFLLMRIIATHAKLQVIENIETDELGKMLNDLEQEYLIEQTVHNGNAMVGLTDEGRRCNYIDVAWL